MKTFKFSAPLLLASLAITAAGCHVDEEVVGKNNGGSNYYDQNGYEYAPTSPTPCQASQLVIAETESEVSGCASPQGTLEAVWLDPEGKLRFKLGKMSDGKYASISTVEFQLLPLSSYYYSSGTLSNIHFICQADPTDTSELTCAEQENSALSNAPLSSFPNTYGLPTFTLENTACGASVIFQSQNLDCAYPTATESDATSGGVNIPHFWAKPSTTPSSPSQ
jgi:hypothetical protein